MHMPEQDGAYYFTPTNNVHQRGREAMLRRQQEDGGDLGYHAVPSHVDGEEEARYEQQFAREEDHRGPGLAMKLETPNLMKARRARPQSPRSAVAASARLDRLLGAQLRDTDHVVVLRVQHTVLANSAILEEIVLGGGTPTGAAGATRAQAGPVRRLSSPYRGVSFHSCTQRWRGRIKHGSKSEHLGYFASDVEAAAAYNVAARKIHGISAQVNKYVEEIAAQNIAVDSQVVDCARVPYAPRPAQHQVVFVKSEPTCITQETLARHPAPFQHQGQAPPSALGATYTRRDEAEVFDELDLNAETQSRNQVPDHLRGNTKSRDAAASLSWEDCFVEFWFDDSSALEAEPTVSNADVSSGFGPAGMEVDGSRCLKRGDYEFTPALDCKRIRC